MPNTIEMLHMEPWQALIGFAILLALIFRRWFWFVALTMGSLAAGTGSWADLMHFHYGGALGHAILALVCWAFAVSVAENTTPPPGSVRDGDGHPYRSDRPDWSPH